jgi:hypothetical protein
MGYYMNQMAQDFFIATENKQHALWAIKNLAGHETIEDGSGRHYSWVDTKGYLGADTLDRAMVAWRWEVSSDEDGNIDGIYFSGQKLGDDYILMKAIAKYVQAGSYIEMSGEDGCLWRYVFDGDTCKEVYAEVIWK